MQRSFLLLKHTTYGGKLRLMHLHILKDCPENKQQAGKTHHSQQMARGLQQGYT
jgi:hypothetical protein